MDNQLWEKVDDYLETALDGRDDVLSEVLFSSREAGLPAIQVSAMQGKFLHVLARLIGARRVLEIGALGGYSAIWLGRALPPEGKLVSLEVDARHAEVARANIDRAGLSALAEVRVGPALAALPGLVEEFGEGSFDLSFIDADKRNNPAYFRWALRLTRPGGAIVVDNVVRQGRVADPAQSGPDEAGTRQLFAEMASEPSVTAAALQTVGSKGYDGFAIAFVGIPQPSEVAS
ncbi:MAG TPA: O-methyltransferase [Acidimicrobiales bacterium]|nr:O-methyltransferase [Acidimicrobiales bacterium]